MDDTSELGAGDSGVESISSNDVAMATMVHVSIPDLNLQKLFQFNHDETVWIAKQQVLLSFAKDLKNGFNYGFYCPPTNGKAGKFLDEERLLKEYSPIGSNWKLEFKMKRRVYKSVNLTVKRAKQLNSKGSFKQLMEHVMKAESEKIMKLLNKGLDPNFIDFESEETPLTLACSISRPSKVIVALVGGGAHLDFRNKKGMTPIHAAAWKGNEEAVKVLLDLGSSANYKDLRGLTPLYLGVCNGASSRCIEMLLYDHSIIDTVDEQGWTELHQSCKAGRVQHVELLIYFGADLNRQNCSGNTPLHISVINDREDCVQTLLFRGANKLILNNSSKQASQCALISGNTRLMETINNFSELEVVPHLDAPKYNSKRRVVHLLPAMALKRSRSNPSVDSTRAGMGSRDANVPQEGHSLWNRNQQQQQQQHHHMLEQRRRGRNSTALLDLSVFGRRGSSPPPPSSDPCPVDGSDNQSSSISSADSSQEGEVVLEHKHFSESKCSAGRKVVLSTDSSDFGFILRGTKADKIIFSRKNLVPTPAQPALQYFEQVKANSLADKAGIKSGDFLLEVNGVDVTSASHEYAVSLIKNSVHMLEMVITPGQVSSHHFNSTDHHQRFVPTSACSMPTAKRTASNLKTFFPPPPPPPPEFPSVDRNVASIRSVHGKRLAHDLPADEHDRVRVVSAPMYNGNSLSRRFLWKAKSVHNISRSDDICYMFNDDDDGDGGRNSGKSEKENVGRESTEMISFAHCIQGEGHQKLSFSDDRIEDVEEEEGCVFSKLQSKNFGIQESPLASIVTPVPHIPLTHSHSVNHSRSESPRIRECSKKVDPTSPLKREVVLDYQRAPSNEENPEKQIKSLNKMIRNDQILLKDQFAVEPYNIYDTRKEISKLALVSNRRQIFESNPKLTDALSTSALDYMRSRDGDKLAKKSLIPPKPPQKPSMHTNKGGIPQPPGIPVPCGNSVFHGENQRVSKYGLMQLPPLPCPESSMQLSITSADLLIVPPPPGFEDDSTTTTTTTTMATTEPVLKPRQFDQTRLPMSVWTVYDVADWLDTMGMGEHRASFLENKVDGTKLSTLGRNDLISLGVTQVGQRMGLERAVKKILISYSNS